MTCSQGLAKKKETTVKSPKIQSRRSRKLPVTRIAIEFAASGRRSSSNSSRRGGGGELRCEGVRVSPFLSATNHGTLLSTPVPA